MPAVEQTLTLEYATPELRDNEEVVRAALGHTWQALEAASERLRDDKDIVMAAVCQEGGYGALEWASERLRCDRGIVLRAIAHGPHGLVDPKWPKRDVEELLAGLGGRKLAVPRLRSKGRRLVSVINTPAGVSSRTWWTFEDQQSTPVELCSP